MSGQKSKIKADLFRKGPFAPTCVSYYATAHPRLAEPTERAQHVAGSMRPVSRDGPVHDTVTLICEDASVRYCTFLPASGDNLECVTKTRDIVEHFARPVIEAFAAPGNALHTYVYVFDKRALVPKAKSGTQTKRAVASEKVYAKTHGGDAALADEEGQRAWAWKNRAESGPILGCNGKGLEAPLPPWDLVRRRAGARDAIITELSWLLACYLADGKLPVHARLIIDGGCDPATHAHDTLLVCEPGQAPRWVPGCGNLCGEADIAGQWWAAWPPVASGTRGQYRRGDVTLRTTDTDYLIISMLAYADRVARGKERNPHNVYVSLNTPVHVHHTRAANWTPQSAGERSVVADNDDDFACDAPGPVVACKKTDPGAVPCREVYDVKAMCEALAKEHQVALSECLDACVSFAVCTSLAGNDYIERLPRFTHGAVWAVYEGWVLRKHEGIAAAATRTAPPQGRYLAETVRVGREMRVNVPPARFCEFVKEMYREMIAPKGGSQKRKPLKRARESDSENGDDGESSREEDPTTLPSAPTSVSWRHVYMAARSMWPQSRAHLGPPTAQAVGLLWERVFWTVNYMFSATQSSGYSAPPVSAIGQWV